MVSRTLIRYFGMRFLGAVMSVFFGIFVLIVLVDYIELMRRAADVPNLSPWMVAKASFFRVPQLTERLLPFSVLVGAMACYLALSRRNELVVARAAGMSAWQFVTPALIVAFALGIVATAIYNPLSAAMREWSKKLEAEMFGEQKNVMQQQNALGFWVRQRSSDGQSIAYWQLDVEGVREFYLVSNVSGLYAQIESIPYPKVGETNPAARVGVVASSGGDTTWMNLPGDPREHYISQLDWAGASDQLILQQFNRLQNSSTI